MKIIETKEGKFKLSDNGLFLLKIDNLSEIYIKESKLDEIKISNSFFKNLLQLRQATRLNKDSIYNGYIKYTINKDFEIKGDKNDCLLFAERVSINDPHYKEKKSIFRVISDKTHRRFGVSDKQNQEILKYTRNIFSNDHGLSISQLQKR